MAIRLTVAELERHKTNMNTKEKHIIRSILNGSKANPSLMFLPIAHFPVFSSYWALLQFNIDKNLLCLEGVWWIHSQKKQLTPLYIFSSVSFELSLYSWISGLDDDIKWSELFHLRVYGGPDTLWFMIAINVRLLPHRALHHSMVLPACRVYGCCSSSIFHMIVTQRPSRESNGKLPTRWH